MKKPPLIKVSLYRFVSDQFSSFYTKVINTNARDAVHVIDGLLHHETDLHMEVGKHQEPLLAHIPPLGWEHINFLGQYKFDINSSPFYSIITPL